MRRGLLILLVLLVFVIPTDAQSDSAVAIAGVRDNALILISPDAETIIDDGEYAQYPLDANSRGEVLYMYWTSGYGFDVDTQKLYLFDGEQSRLITDRFWIGTAPYFLDDDTIIYVSNTAGPQVNDDDGTYTELAIMSHDLTTDTAQQIGIYHQYRYGSGGGRPPMDDALVAENFSLIFTWIVPAFNAAVPTYDLDDTGTVVGISSNQSRVITHRATPTGFDLNIVDVATGASRLLKSFADKNLTSLVWAPDGLIYFATSNDYPATYTLTPEETDALIDITGYRFWDLTKQSEINLIDPDTSGGTRIYQVDNVWAISRLTVLDGYLYWSEVPDGAEVIEAMRDGSLTTDYDRDNLFSDYLLPDVYRMPLPESVVVEPELVATGIRRFLPVPIPTSD